MGAVGAGLMFGLESLLLTEPLILRSTSYSSVPRQALQTCGGGKARCLRNDRTVRIDLEAGEAP
jgi:hypothetical protein